MLTSLRHIDVAITRERQQNEKQGKREYPKEEKNITTESYGRD